MVERQLCKLDVRGSNPLASKAFGREARVYNGRAALLGWAGANPLASKASVACLVATALWAVGRA